MPTPEPVASKRTDHLFTKARRRRIGPIADPIYDLALKSGAGFRQATLDAARMPIRKILLAAVDVPSRRAGLEQAIATLSNTRHDISVIRAPMGEKGKFDNIADGIAGIEVNDFDWFIVFDDDIVLPPGFLDLFIYISEQAAFALSMPAHKFGSYRSFNVTERSWRNLARTTRFVECGPVTAFHRSLYADILPFPQSRYGWGLDILWSEVAHRRGLNVGIVDATPIQHTRPVAGSYKAGAASEEMAKLLAARSIVPDWTTYLVTTKQFARFA